MGVASEHKDLKVDQNPCRDGTTNNNYNVEVNRLLIILTGPYSRRKSILLITKVS